ncbi:MAG: NYN domain-containing protein [Patescibacteria group bacterium]
MQKDNKKKENNYAFIDGQNLHLQTEWKIDFERLRIYLKDKFNVVDAYYFLGFKGNEERLYRNLQKAGFILVFNERGENLQSEKKGNIDTNLVFEVMKSLIEDDFDKIMIISGDGDYRRVIDYLIEKKKFRMLLVPSNNVSSLYNSIGKKFVSKIDNARNKIEYKRKKSHRD